MVVGDIILRYLDAFRMISLHGTLVQKIAAARFAVPGITLTFVPLAGTHVGRDVNGFVMLISFRVVCVVFAVNPMATLRHG